MNQKDYKAIAVMIKFQIPNQVEFINMLADYFEEENNIGINPSKFAFDKKQFLKDCGVEVEE